MLSKGEGDALTKALLLLLAVAGCTDPKFGTFTMPRRLDDVRGKLLPYVEGHPIEEARAFLRDHGYSCDQPMPSAVDAHAHDCHAVAQDAGWSRWTITLLERKGRVADLDVR